MTPQKAIIDRTHQFGEQQHRQLEADAKPAAAVAEETKFTILFVTHDVREAILLGDRVLVFTPRPGRIKQELAVDLPRPRDETTEAFVRTEATLLEALGL